MRLHIVFTSAMTTLAISIALLVASGNDARSPWFWMSVVLFLVSIFAWNFAINQAKIQDKKDERHKTALLEKLDRLIELASTHNEPNDTE